MCVFHSHLSPTFDTVRRERKMLTVMRCIFICMQKNVITLTKA